MVRSSLRDSPDTCVFFQVPDVLRVLEEEAFWDIYYEHCSYFSVGSLARLFRRAGFDVLDARAGVQRSICNDRSDGQVSGAASPSSAEDDLENVKTLVQSFAARVPRRIAEWRRTARELS